MDSFTGAGAQVRMRLMASLTYVPCPGRDWGTMRDKAR